MSKPAVLFLCTGNSARSQMAEALLRKYGGDYFEVNSAGLEPCGIHSMTIQVMEEMGCSLEGHYSKTTKDFLGRVPIRYAIIVCQQAEKECPRLWPFGATVLFWPFDDPAACEGDEETRLQKFRDVRDQIEHRIKEWLATELDSVETAASEEGGTES